jgi:hypothetical protein
VGVASVAALLVLEMYMLLRARRSKANEILPVSNWVKPAEGGQDAPRPLSRAASLSRRGSIYRDRVRLAMIRERSDSLA